MLIHKPVLLKEVLSFIPDNAKLIVDGTLGHGGHTLAMLEKLVESPRSIKSIKSDEKTFDFTTGGPLTIIGIDLDQKMLDKAKERINQDPLLSTQHLALNTSLIHDSYANIKFILGDKKADFILIDIGVNLEHFKNTERGFSIKGNAELDMRFDQKQEKSAYTIINAYPASELVRIFEEYADFAAAKAQEIAQAIISHRKKSPIKDTFGLKTILNACGLGEKAIAVIFQAIRIETNGELDNLNKFLTEIPDCLNLGGRCAVISYHSGEDRITKNAFKALEDLGPIRGKGKYKILTKKAIQPHYTEIQSNKAARSAKLRVIEKII